MPPPSVASSAPLERHLELLCSTGCIGATNLPILCLIFFALCLKYNAMTFVKHRGKLLAEAEVYLTC